MGGHSGYTCVRYIFCWLNIILWLSGCCLLGLGIFLHLQYSGYTSLVPQYALGGADFLCVVLGVIIFVIAFTGCCGAWTHSRCLLVFYFTLVILMFILEFGTAALAFVFRDKISGVVRSELLTGIANHYNVTNTEDSENPVHIWDHVQTEFHCCGVNDYVDWFKISAWPTEDRVPDSCCLPEFQKFECGKIKNPDHWWTKGCGEGVKTWLVHRLHLLGIVGLVVAFIQLFGLISSMLLFCTVKHRRTSHTYQAYDRTT